MRAFGRGAQLDVLISLAQHEGLPVALGVRIIPLLVQTGAADQSGILHHQPPPKVTEARAAGDLRMPMVGEGEGGVEATDLEQRGMLGHEDGVHLARTVEGHEDVNITHDPHVVHDARPVLAKCMRHALDRCPRGPARRPAATIAAAIGTAALVAAGCRRAAVASLGWLPARRGSTRALASPIGPRGIARSEQLVQLQKLPCARL